MRKKKITVNISAIIVLICIAIILLTSCGGSSEQKVRITGIRTETGTLIIVEHEK